MNFTKYDNSSPFVHSECNDTFVLEAATASEVYVSLYNVNFVAKKRFIYINIERCRSEDFKTWPLRKRMMVTWEGTCLWCILVGQQENKCDIVWGKIPSTHRWRWRRQQMRQCPNQTGRTASSGTWRQHRWTGSENLRPSLWWPSLSPHKKDNNGLNVWGDMFMIHSMLIHF